MGTQFSSPKDTRKSLLDCKFNPWPPWPWYCVAWQLHSSSHAIPHKLACLRQNKLLSHYEQLSPSDAQYNRHSILVFGKLGIFQVPEIILFHLRRDFDCRGHLFSTLSLFENTYLVPRLEGEKMWHNSQVCRKVSQLSTKGDMLPSIHT